MGQSLGGLMSTPVQGICFSFIQLRKIFKVLQTKCSQQNSRANSVWDNHGDGS